jgi:DNA modification methylase
MIIHDSKYGKAYQGDCLDIMKTLPDNSIETVITDPPAGIGFMGKEWDKNKGGKANWVEWCRVRFQEALRLAKPGGLAAVWALPKTSNWTMNAVEDAGWSIKTKVYFLFGGGFPKGSDIGKRLDAAAGMMRENVDNPFNKKQTASIDNPTYHKSEVKFIQPVPVTETAAAWNGWKTELKPMCEEWIIAEKPLDIIHWNELHELTGQDYWHEVIELREGKQRRKFEEIRAVPASSRVILIKHKPLVPGLKFFDSIIVDDKPMIITNQKDFKPWKVRSYAANALKWGVAGFNIDECRIETDEILNARQMGSKYSGIYGDYDNDGIDRINTKGRYPGTVTIDQYIAEEMDREIGWQNGGTPGIKKIKSNESENISMSGKNYKRESIVINYPSGGPSRYFNRVYHYYGSKAGNDKHEGLDNLEPKITTDRETPADYPSNRGKIMRKNHHPTVKSLEFKQYLCRLTKPPSPGTVLDIFGGTFTTALAAYRENRKFIIIEQDQEFCQIGLARLKAAMEQKKFDF